MSVAAYRKWKETPNTRVPFLSIVIPAYNESERILPTIGAIATFVSSQGYEWELIISDDGSTDNTASLVGDLGWPNLTVLSDGVNRGKGGAVSQGVAAAKGEYILLADADQSTPIEQLTEFVNIAVADKTPIVIGSRALASSEVANKSGFRYLLSNGLNTIVRAVFRLDLSDTQCGFKLLEADAAKRVFEVSTIDGFSFDLEMLYVAQNAGLAIKEVPVEWHDAPDSKVDGAKVAFRFLTDMPKILLNRVLGRYRIAK